MSPPGLVPVEREHHAHDTVTGSVPWGRSEHPARAHCSPVLLRTRGLGSISWLSMSQADGHKN